MLSAQEHYEQAMSFLNLAGMHDADQYIANMRSEYAHRDPYTNQLLAAAQTHAMLANHQLVQASLDQAAEVIRHAETVGAAEEKARQLAAEAQARLNQVADEQ